MVLPVVLVHLVLQEQVVLVDRQVVLELQEQVVLVAHQVVLELQDLQEQVV